jgi:hypothetical protein
VGKRPFIDGSKTFDLRGAFPDFEFNAHDFRVDEVSSEEPLPSTTTGLKPSCSQVQPWRVWFTTRKTGTHLGDLPMYGQVSCPHARSSPLVIVLNCVAAERPWRGAFSVDQADGQQAGLPARDLLFHLQRGGARPQPFLAVKVALTEAGLDEQGKAVKMTGGFVMDGTQGTSGGLGGTATVPVEPQAPTNTRGARQGPWVLPWRWATPGRSSRMSLPSRR